MKIRQKKDKWYKIDFLLDWEKNKTTMYVDNISQAESEFYHGTDRMAWSTQSDIEYNGVDGLLLYTLSKGTNSQFMDVKVCSTKCRDHQELRLGGMRLDFKL